MKKKILIAGINNFLGFHLALKLSEKFDVIGTLSKDIKKYNLLEKFRIRILKKKITLIKYNVFKDNIKKIIITYSPNIWIHNISISKNWKEKKFNVKKNINVASKNLEKIIPELKKNNCELFIFSGSSEEYPRKKNILYEKILQPPDNNYGKMKFLLSKKILMLSRQNTLNCAIIRLFSPYGLLDKETKVISKINTKKNKIKIENINIERNFTFINDVVNGYLQIIKFFKKKKQYKIFNLANPNKIKLFDILKKWNDINKKKIKIFSSHKKVLDKFYYGKPSLKSNKSIKNVYTNIEDSIKIMNKQKNSVFKDYYENL